MLNHVVCLALLAPAAPQQDPDEQDPAPRTGRATRGDVTPATPELQINSHLTGDWGGWHDWLEKRGVEPTLALVTDASVIARGGVNRGATGLRSLLDFECSFYSEPLLGWPDGRLYFDLQVQRGSDGSRDTGDFQVYSNIDGPNRIQLAQIFAEQSFGDGALRLKLGKSDANSDFAYVEHGLRHIHSSFGFAPTVLAFPTYPDPAFGGAVFVEPGGALHFAAGVYDGATQAGIATGHRGPRTVLGSPSDLFAVGEVGLHWRRGESLPGHFGLGAWRHTGSFARSSGGLDDGTTGYYLVGDQMLWQPENDPDTNRGIGAFLQYGYADPEVSIVEHYFGCGATWTGPLAARPLDACGVGIAMALWRDRPSEDLAGAGEVAVELFYSLQLTPWLHLKPDVQYIRNPGGQPGVSDAWVATLRMSVEF